MKKSLCAAAVLVIMASASIGFGADAVKTTPQEYFKHAGTAADPSYQDYIATKQAQEAKQRADQQKNNESYAAQQARIRDRVNNSPKYTIPNFNKKGSYGQAK